MTKILILSDLHFECHADHGLSFCQSIKADYDVVVIAGDLCTYRSLRRSLTIVSKHFKEVVYVMGNHEAWKSSLTHAIKRIEKICKDFPNIHFLNNSVFEFQGRRFIGSTLWFKYPTADACLIAHSWSDFEEIKRLHVEVGDYNRSSVYFLQENVQPGDIVVTHHLPSRKSIDPRYARSNTNVFYITDIEHVIHFQKPKLWIHGHTHASLDYNIGRTSVICNPFGYVTSELNLDFNDSLVVEV
ncbi:MAG: metallophosphoesterase [Lentisphaeria bacterium]